MDSLSKTPGQIAYETTKADPFTGSMVPDWEFAGVGRQRMWDAAANAVLEEAAKAICPRCAKGDKVSFDEHFGKHCHRVSGCAASPIWALRFPLGGSDG